MYGSNPIDDESRADYFDSMFHSAAVVGLNTSALVEAAIVDRPVFTILPPEFSENQEGTFHFHYLLTIGGGFLHQARSVDEHVSAAGGRAGRRRNEHAIASSSNTSSVRRAWQRPPRRYSSTLTERLARQARPRSCAGAFAGCRSFVRSRRLAGRWRTCAGSTASYWTPNRWRKWADAHAIFRRKAEYRRAKLHDKRVRLAMKTARAAGRSRQDDREERARRRPRAVIMTTAFQSHPALAGLGSGRCLIIGEVALTHDGSLGLAHAFIDAIAAAGADAVKFQTHIAAAESTPAEPFRVKFSKQDASRYDYWKRMEFTEEQWRGLAEHARERGVLFVSSPFSIEAVDLLERVGMPFWKIASGETSNPMLLDRILDTGAPVMLSTGMSPGAEIDAAVERVKDRGVPVGVFQCTTAYPCPPEKIGLNLIPEYRERYGCWVGLSDHSATIYPASPGRRSASICSRCTSRSRGRCSGRMSSPR